MNYFFIFIFFLLSSAPSFSKSVNIIESLDIDVETFENNAQQ